MRSAMTLVSTMAVEEQRVEEVGGDGVVEARGDQVEVGPGHPNGYEEDVSVRRVLQREEEGTEGHQRVVHVHKRPHEEGLPRTGEACLDDTLRAHAAGSAPAGPLAGAR